jgi:putative tricarboxylic transport membrane protein
VRQTAVDRWLGIVLMAAGAIWSWLVLATISPTGMPGAPGPRAFPLLLGGLLSLLGLVMTILSLSSAKPGGDAEGSIVPVRRDEVAIVGGGFAVILLYAFLMERIGFLLATPIVVILALRVILGIRKLPALVFAAAGLTLGCYVVFGMLMQANLPHGSWVDFG